MLTHLQPEYPAVGQQLVQLYEEAKHMADIDSLSLASASEIIEAMGHYKVR